MQQQIQQTGQIEFVMYTGRVNASHYIEVCRSVQGKAGESISANLISWQSQW
jgi:hypothetical protein